ncbi:MAG: hypothetical protein VX278_04190 [Myxococcota bacterium]|nr:hypothetical protein [Myxococcota bacterium]
MTTLFYLVQLSFAADNPNWSLIFQADDKLGLQMERISGTFKTSPNNLFWHSDGYILRQYKGYQNLNVSGTQYYTTTLKKGAIPLIEKRKEGAKEIPGKKIISQMRGNRKINYLVQKDGSKKIIARGVKKFSQPLWISNPPAKPRVKHAVPSDSLKWIYKKGSLQNVPPADSKRLPNTQISQKQRSKLEKEIRLFNPKASIKHTSVINLDGDSAKESLICVKGREYTGCYVMDVYKGENRYYTVGVKWLSGEQKDAPFVFQQGQNTYIGHKAKPNSKLMRVVYFDGYGYSTKVMRKKQKKQKK